MTDKKKSEKEEDPHKKVSQAKYFAKLSDGKGISVSLKTTSIRIDSYRTKFREIE